jgi:hypothetical protein
VKGRQDGRISPGLERGETEGAYCATGVLQDRSVKGSAFCDEPTDVLGVGELFQPIVKRQQTGVDA